MCDVADSGLFGHNVREILSWQYPKYCTLSLRLMNNLIRMCAVSHDAYSCC